MSPQGLFAGAPEASVTVQLGGYDCRQVRLNSYRSEPISLCSLGKARKDRRDDKKVEIERFSLISPKPFDQVVAAVNAAVGHPDMAEFGRSTHAARSFAKLKRAVEKGLSKAGLMLFVQLDQGAVVQKETGRDTPRIIRLLIGSPLIMKEMAKHVPDAGSYAPVTVLVDERADGVHLSYDRMASCALR